MAEIALHWSEEVLEFWFGEVDEDGLADEGHIKRWWTKDPEFDREIAARFGHLLAAEHLGHLEPGLQARSRLAALIVLDQFSRNVGRGTAKMFVHDEAALALAKRMVEEEQDRALPASRRSFCYMPLMHSEDLADQEQCIALFESMADEFGEPVHSVALNHVDFARRHHVIVERFGRFPHRNEVLGRESTAEEVAFLQEDGSSF